MILSVDAENTLEKIDYLSHAFYHLVTKLSSLILETKKRISWIWKRMSFFFFNPTAILENYTYKKVLSLLSKL